MLNTPFSPWPSFTQVEADAVSQVLLSNKVNYWTGQECRQFETEFAKWSDSQYAVAMGNGTLALDVALQALAEKMIYFIEHPEQIKIMGGESYKMAQERFDSKEVNQRLLDIIGV